ncbi:MAG TPA: T9SS type A sorting domain-containing protein [Ignavibacteriaceae bacterium]|nr:T9SS type A sorting domain-containing protein [Ignavibacteriaceae bacterium]
MKLFFNKYFVIILFLLTPLVYAQEIQIITHGMTKYEPLGTLEIVIDFEVVNISPFEQIVFEVRTLENLPSGWESSLCFGELCFAPFVDSVATTPDFQTPPVQPGDTLKTSIHVFTDQVTVGTGYVQIEVGTFRNPEDRFVLDFTATTDPAVSVNENNLFNTYYLFQNYPNPFNPSTRINYNVGEPGLVQLKVYNILGVEVATLVNEQQNSGNYTVGFNAAKLSSGVYFYSLSVNNFTQTRKMILEK